jgi:hypothetical protein
MDGTLLRDGPASPGPGLTDASALAQQWLDVWREAGACSWGLMALALFHDVRQTRRAWLADLTRTADSYLRSPAFLELVRGPRAASPTKDLPPIQLG